MLSRSLKLTCLTLLLALANAASPVLAAKEPTIGPSGGYLVIAGGGKLGPDIVGRFLDLAGGKDAPIVVIPTAGAANRYDNSWKGLQLFKAAGATHLTVLHTRDPRMADSPDFVRPLRQARGVWFTGGRQWRLADSYLHTRTQQELFALLRRGGVIGGSSAGASIQASYLVRGAPEGNRIMMAPGHEKGLGFLHHTAIDQHLLARHRENDLIAVIKAHPELLGIGLDEGTAIIVHGNIFEVVGRSKVAVYDNHSSGWSNGHPYFFLSKGDRYDLAGRHRLPSQSRDRAGN